MPITFQMQENFRHLAHMLCKHAHEQPPLILRRNPMQLPIDFGHRHSLPRRRGECRARLGGERKPAIAVRKACKIGERRRVPAAQRTEHVQILPVQLHKDIECLLTHRIEGESTRELFLRS